MKRFLPYIFIVLIGFIILHGIFQSGYLVRSDNSVHEGRAYLLKENINNGKIFSWDYYDAAGSPFLTYAYILPYIFTASISFLIPLELAYKLILFLSFVVPACLLYFILSQKFNKISALLASVLFLFNFKVIQEILEGIFNQYTALIFLLLFFYFLEKYSNNLDFKKTAILSVLFSLIVLSHLYVAMSAAYLFLIYFIFRIKNKKLSLLIPLLSFLLLSFYIFPILETSSWTIGEGGWEISSSFFNSLYSSIGILFSLQKLKEISVQNVISVFPILLLDIAALIGIFLYLKKKNNDFLKVNLWFLIVSFAIGTGFWFSLLKDSFFGTIPAYRFLTMGIIPLIIFASYAFYELKLNKTTSVALLAVLIIFSFTYFQPADELTRTSENSPELNDYYSTLDYLETLDMQNARVIFQSPYRVYQWGVYSPLYFDRYKLNIPVIGVFCDPILPACSAIDSTDNKILGTPVEEIAQEEIIEKMKAYNAKYLVSITPELTNKLTKLKKLNSSGGITILELENYNPEWALTSANYALKQWQPYPVFEINNNEENNIMMVKTAYHPYWRAYINDKEVEIFNENNLIRINLEKGNYNRTLKYYPNKLIYMLLSLVGAAACIYFILVNDKRKAYK